MHHLNADQINYVYGGNKPSPQLEASETALVLMSHILATSLVMNFARVSPIESVPFCIFSSPFSLFFYYQSKK